MNGESEVTTTHDAVLLLARKVRHAIGERVISLAEAMNDYDLEPEDRFTKASVFLRAVQQEDDFYHDSMEGALGDFRAWIERDDDAAA